MKNLTQQEKTVQHRVVRKQHNSRLCFICGLRNDSGLHASFYETEGNELIALFVPTDEHQSYPGRLHGGIASAILDETIGRAILIGGAQDVWGVTIELHLEYRKPIPLGVQLKVVGRVTENASRFFRGTGEIVLPGGEIAVTAHGRYLKAPLEKIADFDPVENEWRVVEMADDPVTIDL